MGRAALYTWLQILAFHGLGLGVLALALLKNVFLAGVFLFTYLAAREITRDSRLAALAALGLLLFPQITWESQRDLTHSVLASTIAAATLYCGLRAWRTGHWLDYLWLGLVVGCGTLSKISYCLFALALGLAALSLPGYRSVFLRRGILVSLAAFGLLTALYFQWIWLSPELALKRSQDIVRSNRGEAVQMRARAVLSVGKCLVMLGGGLLLAYWVAFRAKPAVSGGRGWAEPRALLGRTLVIIGAIVVVVVVGFGIALKDRWFQPVVFLGAILGALLVADRLTATAEGRVFKLLTAIAGLAVILLPLIPLSASVTRRPTRLNAPYTLLAKALKERVGEPPQILTSTRWVAGNLRFRFPSSTVVAPEFHALPWTPRDRALVVWDATKAAAPPLPLVNLVSNRYGLSLDQLPPSFVDAGSLYTPAKRMKLGYVTLSASARN
ncbi:MAG: glycosyltransferase family 39 protein [Verrucomicrobiota bacterium]